MVFWGRICLATLVSAAFGFTFHVLYGRGWAVEYMDAATKAGRMDGLLQEPYPVYIVVIAALTALIPTLGKVFIWLFIREKLPGKNLLIKGIWFTVIMMIADSDLLRQGIMNLLIGMPIDVWFVYSAEQWIIVPTMCFLIVALCPKNKV
ncbi:hypothetical protein OP862_02685 [Yersinia massiliensis]|jgi:hypothetical protein|uniref:DUF3995 domain-containing protein n=2 Tax=Yersinia TaxID=629 RepID=A0A2R4NKE7_9GAMM|nr:MULTISPECIES: hypothetical protein [Yersinia]HEC1648673.1 hypothetical protein [Yersinia enterocolitica]ATM87562.1 hypothetical protein CRN74_16640 [Yersinia frederiksenii]AVX36589.1 hypothetical protein DA391_02265 [Yersinia massiliensis]MCB5319361.1 hypothetical protein [Yersinia massiliensis]MDA5550272.1 hypothetical protein [Yersinia massiliensis]